MTMRLIRDVIVVCVLLTLFPMGLLVWMLVRLTEFMNEDWR